MANPRAVRKAYLTALEEFLDRIREGCRSMQIDYELVQTDQPLDLALRTLLGNRCENRKY